jgi:hypothetical protein
VNYILVGPPEREAHPGVEDRFRGIGDRLAAGFQERHDFDYEVR